MADFNHNSDSRNHSHQHSHHHTHQGLNHHSHDGHSHTYRSTKTMLIVLILTATYMLVEFLGGYLSQSLALWSDAVHMLTDSGALLLAYISIRMARRPATAKFPFGFRRTEILGAFSNGIVLVVASFWIIAQAIHRFFHPQTVQTSTLISIATVGLILNLFCGFLLYKESHRSLAVRGAFLHVAGDALGSLGAIFAGQCILKFGWLWMDPLVSLLTTSLILISAFKLIKDSARVLVQSSPSVQSTENVQNEILSYPEVASIHDLYLWSLTPEHVVLSAHLVLKTTTMTNSSLLMQISSKLKTKFGIQHVTLQVENSSEKCDH